MRRRAVFDSAAALAADSDSDSSADDDDDSNDEDQSVVNTKQLSMKKQGAEASFLIAFVVVVVGGRICIYDAYNVFLEG